MLNNSESQLESLEIDSDKTSLLKKIGEKALNLLSYGKKKALPLTLAVIMVGSAATMEGCGASEAQPDNQTTVEEYQKGDSAFVEVSDMKYNDFYEAYGALYTDPESAYAALNDYEKENNGESLIISQSYIDSYYEYVKDYGYSTHSPLGFENMLFTSKEAPTAKQSMDIYNNYIREQLTTYANLIKANPSAQEIIDDQFLSSCGSQQMSNLGDSNPTILETMALMNTVKSIVNENENSFNFNFTKARSIDEIYANGENPDDSMSIFNTVGVCSAAFDNENNLTSFSFGSMQTVIDYDIYNGKDFESSSKVLENGIAFNITVFPLDNNNCAIGQIP